MLEAAAGFGGACVLGLITWLIYRRSAQHAEALDYGSLTQEVRNIGELMREVRADVRTLKDNLTDMNGRLGFLEGKTNGQPGRGHHA